MALEIHKDNKQTQHEHQIYTPTPNWQRHRGRSQKKVKTTQELADTEQEGASKR
jgi:hypothetical protein